MDRAWRAVITLMLAAPNHHDDYDECDVPSLLHPPSCQFCQDRLNLLLAVFLSRHFPSLARVVPARCLPPSPAGQGVEADQLNPGQNREYAKVMKRWNS